MTEAHKKKKKKKAYGTIDDEFSNIRELRDALNKIKLESSNLIIGIDFTKSNEWTGKCCFDGRSLHTISSEKLNPYEHAISIIWKTLSDYDADKQIPCFGFGDLSTHDEKVFSFYHDGRPCVGMEEVLARYRELLPHLILSGPTSFAPIINAAIDVVRERGCEYHILVIIADGQVTGNIGVDKGRRSLQEKNTIDAIVNASNYPLSIVVVGVGDGPWDTMHLFNDAIPSRKFDNFQFVNYTEIMGKGAHSEEMESAFALAALMEIPQQYKAIKKLRIARDQISKAVIVPPPLL